MSVKHNQPGFHIVELLLALATLGMVGFLGYTYYSNSQLKNNSSSQVVNQTKTDVAPAPAIKSNSDLTKAEKVLNDTDLDSTADSSQLDAQTAGF